MIVQHLRRLGDLAEELKATVLGQSVLTIPLGGKMPASEDMAPAPHDYQTFMATSPARCRVVGFVVPSRASGWLAVRHVLLGKERVPQFHGGALPAEVFSEGRSDKLAWGVLEEGDPIEVNLAWVQPGAGFEDLRMVLLAVPLGAEDALVQAPAPKKRRPKGAERFPKGKRR